MGPAKEEAPVRAELKVMLVGYTPDPEGTVAAAAKLCYSAANMESIVSVLGRDGRDLFLKKLIASGHLSPIEHASFTFGVEGISRACSHQLVRHRLASYSQQSQRYVGKAGGFRYIVPPSIHDDGEGKKGFEDIMEAIADTYKQLTEILIKNGASREQALEDARFVLPNAAETKIFITMNARELLHFFDQRLCNRAQWEIREMAMAMLRLVKPVAPVIFRHAGPSCLRGSCREGSLSCGKMEEVRAILGSQSNSLTGESARGSK